MKYFASYREAVGISDETIETPENSTVKDIIEIISIKHPNLGSMSDAIHALNQNVVDLNAKVKEGDTLAIFPLVGGG